jgi:hypothetical protein
MLCYHRWLCSERQTLHVVAFDRSNCFFCELLAADGFRHQQQGALGMQLDHLSQYFRQEDLSDVILKIKLRAIEPDPEDGEQPAKRPRLAAEAAAAQGEDQVLAQFPAHRLVLFGTDYFKTQVTHGLTRVCLLNPSTGTHA